MRAVVLLSLCLTTAAVADDRIDALYRAKQLCKAEKITLVTSIKLGPEHRGEVALYWPDADMIEINLLDDYWETSEARAALAFKHHYYSSGHVDHIIRHEVGHARFYRRVGIERALEVRAMPFGITPARIAATVGSYAATNNIEFVAEVFCGLRDNRKYPDDVLNYYYSLWERPADDEGRDSEDSQPQARRR